jgi:hypothetical protein
MSDARTKDGPANIKIGVNRETRQKFERIAKAKRWTLVVVADAAADALIERENIAQVDGGAAKHGGQRTRKTRVA